MLSIIVAFPKIEDAEKIKRLLIQEEFEVNAVCTTGAQVVWIANGLDGGIVICGYRLLDMLYRQLNSYLPKGFELLLMASPTKLSQNIDGNLVSLTLPVKRKDLIDTLRLMTYNYYNRKKKKEADRPRKRSEKEKEIIVKAKLVLMERNNMSEKEAYRYIQKTSMDSGINMVEMAKMILNLI